MRTRLIDGHIGVAFGRDCLLVGSGYDYVALRMDGVVTYHLVRYWDEASVTVTPRGVMCWREADVVSFVMAMDETEAVDFAREIRNTAMHIRRRVFDESFLRRHPELRAA